MNKCKTDLEFTLALIAYHDTPLGDQVPGPAELLFGRRLNSRLSPLMTPFTLPTEQKMELNQRRSAHLNPSGPQPSLTLEQPIWIQDPASKIWYPGTAQHPDDASHSCHTHTIGITWEPLVGSPSFNTGQLLSKASKAEQLKTEKQIIVEENSNLDLNDPMFAKFKSLVDEGTVISANTKVFKNATEAAAEEPKAEEASAEEPKASKASAEESKAKEDSAKEPKAEKASAKKPKAEEQKNPRLKKP
ncbi:hypothetical protein CAPTEDRAFT_202765 [Capitella teleta]|uniref:Uncharacterized protein n=1 Tax=Capitella teleta TaxID=283909 RepID=R7TB52_CAPTE|nr:hypothetical protein CAPTEDRAFT_202765 [Capitella teleta]|eukprot:ELT88229.1 hypothetical protein CAPTEDRAFT_202765 [Capitella teleta]